jgi:hypothetical protein
MERSTVLMALVIATISTAWAMAPARAEKKDIFGWVEHVLVGDSRLDLKAKLDTGADTSSIHATRIRRFRSSEGALWVEFRLTDDSADRTIRFKKKLVRYAFIKEHEGPSQKRPVVNMRFCLGDHENDVEVSLVDRSGFQYPVLLGRNALAGHVVVDPDLRLTAKPVCPSRDKP